MTMGKAAFYSSLYNGYALKIIRYGRVHMNRYLITIDKIADVKRFVDIAHRERGTFTLSRQNRRVNAKSLLGLFTLDLTKPCVLSAESPAELETLVAKLRENGLEPCISESA